MKQNNHYLNLIIILFITVLSGCSKSSTSSSIPFQGPQNASFETNSNWFVYPTFYSFCSYNSGLGGFLPSQGQRYISLNNYQLNGAASTTYAQIYFYQDSVDFSHSTTLTFDYTLALAPPIVDFTSTGGGGNFPPLYTTITAQVIFSTTSGNITLWSQALNGTTVKATGGTGNGGGGTTNTTSIPASPVQTYNQAITLPSLPTAGTLFFELTASSPGITSTASIDYAVGTFSVDNVRVK